MHTLVSRGRSFLQKNEFIRHVLALMTGTAMAQLVTFAAMPLISRLYSPSEYGVFAAYSSVVAIIAAVGTLKYDMAIMLPRDEQVAMTLKRTVTWVAFAVGLIAAVACLIFAGPISQLINSPEAAPWLVLVGLSSFMLGELAALGFWLNRRSRYKEMASNRVLQSGATALAQLALGVTKFLGPGGLIVGAVVGQLVGVIGLRRRTPELRTAPAPSWHERKTVLRRYRRMPLLNMPTALVDSVRMNGINLIIAAVSIGALGQFSLAWRIVEVPSVLISSAISQVFFQRLTEVPRGHLYAAARRSTIRTAMVGVVPFALVYFLSPAFFPWFFGAQWSEAGSYAQALVPWLFMTMITSPISTIFVVTERQHSLLYFSLFYTAVPVAILLLMRNSIQIGVTIMGAAMAGCLVLFTFLAWRAAKNYDRSAKRED